MSTRSRTTILDPRIIGGVLVGLAVAATAIVLAVPATAKASENPAVSVAASATRTDVLPGETTSFAVTVSNSGNVALPALDLSLDLPAAVTYDPSSVVAVVTAASGGTTVYRGARGAGAGSLALPSPGSIVTAWDGIVLAPGDSLRVTLDLDVNAAVAPSVDELRLVALATAGDAAGAATERLTVLRQALAFATNDA